MDRDLSTPKYLYRFRSAKALLDGNPEEGFFNELSNEEIYFSPLEDLNDPMENFLDLSFQGDHILWTNFFKNYLFSLFLFRSKMSLVGEDKTLTEADINLNTDPMLKTINELEGRAYYEICKKFLKTPTIQKLIKYLSEREMDTSKNELTFFLQSIQLFILDLCANVDEQHFNITYPDKAKKKRNSEAKESLNKLEELVKEVSKNNSTRIQQLAKFTIEQNRPAMLLIKSMDDTKGRNFHLLINFPSLYTKKLKEIMYPVLTSCVACFSSSASNLAMWGYYADGSKGACLIFKPEVKNSEIYLPLKIPYNQDKPFTNMKLTKVLYSKNFPSLPFFRSLGRLTAPTIKEHWYTLDGKISDMVKDIFINEDIWRNTYWNNLQPYINSKTEDWKHEEEYRASLISIFDDDYKAVEKRKIKYKFENLEGIIFGINMSDEHKMKIIEIIQEKSRKYKRTKFNFYQATYNNDSGQIEIFPLDILQNILAHSSP